MLGSLRTVGAKARALVAPQLQVSMDAVASQGVADVSVRGMAVNLFELRQRIRATGNVAKLTSVMKLVASSKLKGVEQRLANGKAFGVSLMNSVSEREEEAAATETEGEKKAQKVLAVVVSTDRGLCGAVNSTVCREAREYFDKLEKAGHELKVFVLGDKGRAQLTRDQSGHLVRAIDSCFDKDPIFPLAAAIGEKVVNEEFDKLAIIYNHYENPAKFHTEISTIPMVAGLDVGVLPASLSGYAVEPENNEEALMNLMEYGVAGCLYYAFLETQACEVAQRVTAMDNASTNAKDMVDRFTLVYNRARQAKITTELTEIIAGAESIAAVEEED